MVRAQSAAGLLLVGLCSGCYDTVPVIGGPDNQCTPIVDSLYEELYDRPQGCVAVFEYDINFALQQWQFVCEPEDEPLEESQARRLTDCCETEGVAVNRDNPTDAFVFFNVDGNGNGDVAVVSQTIAERVFEGSVSEMSPSIRFPMTGWRDPTELAIDCQAETITDVVSYDADGAIPPQAEVEILDNISRTGVPDAMRKDDGELVWTVLLGTGDGWIALQQSSSLGIDF
jgi:hypothetical protein